MTRSLTSVVITVSDPSFTGLDEAAQRRFIAQEHRVDQRHGADRLTRGGPGGLRPDRRSLWYYVEADERKPVVPNFFGFAR